MTKTIGAIFVAAVFNVAAASAQSVLLNPTASQTVTQPTATTLTTLSVNSLNGVAYVNPTSSVDIVTQINTLASTCSSTCIIHVPAGTYTTTATTTPITLQPGQSLIGDGQSNTTITGNPTKLIVWHSTGGFPATAGKISDLTLICGAATTECIDTGDLLYATLENLAVYGATTGDCISLQNSHSWFERSQFHNLTVGEPGSASNLCNVGIHVKAPISPGTTSFGYYDWGTIYQNSANTGVLVDASAQLYNGTRLAIQDNISSGDALQVSGSATANFIGIEGEGSGYGIHTVSNGHVQGCGSSSLPLLADNIGPNPDSYMAIDLLQCLGTNSIALSNYNGSGAATFSPKIYQGNPQVDAGFGFMLQNSSGHSAPVLWYDGSYPLTMGAMQQYQNFGTIAPTWSISGQGDVQQNGSLGVGIGAGCSPAPGAQTGNHEVWEIICGQNAPTLSFQSQNSSSGAKTWGFYSVLASGGNSQFHFGAQSDAYAPGLDAWTCTQSAGTPTGCTFDYTTTFTPAITVTSASTTGTPIQFVNTSGSGSQFNIELSGSASTIPSDGLVVHDVTTSHYPFWFSGGTGPGDWTISSGVFGWSSNATDPRAGGISGLDTGLARSSAGVMCASGSPATYPNPPCTGSLKAAQFIPAGSAPTIAAGTGGGSSPTIAVTGTNTSGVISLTTGTSPTSMATIATVTFNGTPGTAPQGCQLMARNANAAAFFAFVFTMAPTTTTWIITSGGSLASSTAYSWSYICM